MAHSAISHRQIWLIAGPMILANISTPLLGMVDTAVVGHLSSAHYLGAVAIGSMIFTFVFWGFGFLRMATTGLNAQAYGREDPVAMQAVLFQAIWLAILISFVLLIIQTPIRDLALWLVNSSANVEQYTAIYFDIRIWSAPATLMNYAILGWLIGREASKAALLMVFVINVANIVLDLLLVNSFGMHVDGVAWASVVAEYLGLLTGIVLLTRYGVNLQAWQLARRWQNFRAGFRGLEVHGNFMIRTFVLILCFAFFTTQSARQGDIVLAANSVLLNFITFMAFVLDGFANATEVLTGKALGRKNQAELKRALWLTGIWSLMMALIFMLIYALFGQFIIRLLTSIDAVVALADQYLLWVVIAPVFGVWSYLFDGLFVGATRSREMRNTMLFSAVLVYLPAWYFLQGFGNHGLWAAIILFLLARGLSQSLYLPRIMRLTI
ncbi:MAG TPA: MATE family efflux transporter [Methylophaga sp.]|nr:MATE family efflux transporter [Methylophaga sp.]